MTNYYEPKYYFKHIDAPFGVGLVEKTDQLTGLYQYDWPITHNYPYQCYGKYGQVVPYSGHQDEGTSQGSLDWGDTLDYISDLKIGYTGERVYVEVGSGKVEDSFLMPHDLFHFRKSFGSYPVGSGKTYGTGYIGTMVNLLNDRLPYVVQDDPLKPFGYRPMLGVQFDNALCVDSARERCIQAETKAFRKAMSSTVLTDVGSSLVEVRELASLFSTSMAAFGPLFRIAEKEFTASNVIRILNEISAAWLQVQYGLRPLIGMFAEYRQNLEKRVKRGKLDKTIVKGETVVPRLLSCTEKYSDGLWVYGATQPGKPACSLNTEKVGGELAKNVRCEDSEIYNESFGSGGRLMYSLTTEVDFSVKAEWLIVTDPAFVLDQFNLNPNLGHIWEATRLSFIVDWFVKVGDFLSQIEAKHYQIISGNASFEFKSAVRCNLGGEANATQFFRIARFDANGNPVTGSQDIFHEQGQLWYGLAELQKGTLVSLYTTRFGNAVTLLTVLSTALVRARLLAKALPLNSQERRRILQLLNSIG